MPANATDASLCQSIIRIASSLGMDVIAEGVESDAQRAFLIDQGAVRAQGFLFSRPLPASNLCKYAMRHCAPIEKA